MCLKESSLNHQKCHTNTGPSTDPCNVGGQSPIVKTGEPLNRLPHKKSLEASRLILVAVLIIQEWKENCQVLLGDTKLDWRSYF